MIFYLKKYLAAKNESLLEFSKMDASIFTESCGDFPNMGRELNYL